VAVGFGVIIISGPASAAPSNVRTPSQTTAPTSTTATHHVVVTDDWWW
jgi:hypothetical protein